MSHKSVSDASVDVASFVSALAGLQVAGLGIWRGPARYPFGQRLRGKSVTGAACQGGHNQGALDVGYCLCCVFVCLFVCVFVCLSACLLACLSVCCKRESEGASVRLPRLNTPARRKTTKLAVGVEPTISCLPSRCSANSAEEAHAQMQAWLVYSAYIRVIYQSDLYVRRFGAVVAVRERR